MKKEIPIGRTMLVSGNQLLVMGIQLCIVPVIKFRYLKIVRIPRLSIPHEIEQLDRTN